MEPEDRLRRSRRAVDQRSPIPNIDHTWSYERIRLDSWSASRTGRPPPVDATGRPAATFATSRRPEQKRRESHPPADRDSTDTVGRCPACAIADQHEHDQPTTEQKPVARGAREDIKERFLASAPLVELLEDHDQTAVGRH